MVGGNGGVGCVFWEWKVTRLESDTSLKHLIRGETGENSEGLVSCLWGGDKDSTIRLVCVKHHFRFHSLEADDKTECDRA